MIERNRRATLLGALSLLSIPAFAGLARAGTHDAHSTDGGGGREGKGEHDNHFTCPPDSPPDDNHDHNQAS